MAYIAYLDEFGHIGPYIGRDHHSHNDSPVFGLAGFILPLDEVRGFATWFFQRKCDLLDFEIKQAGEHPAVWEKKGSTGHHKQPVNDSLVHLRRVALRLPSQNIPVPTARILRRFTSGPGYRARPSCPFTAPDQPKIAAQATCSSNGTSSMSPCRLRVWAMS